MQLFFNALVTGRSAGKAGDIGADAADVEGRFGRNFAVDLALRLDDADDVHAL